VNGVLGRIAREVQADGSGPGESSGRSDVHVDLRRE